MWNILNWKQIPVLNGIVYEMIKYSDLLGFRYKQVVPHFYTVQKFWLPGLSVIRCVQKSRAFIHIHSSNIMRLAVH